MGESHGISDDDRTRIAEHPWLAGAEVYAELDSTNRRALECCRHTRPPHLIWAERQTAGRGRGANRWWSEPGGLMFSVTLDAAQYGLNRERLPILSLVVGWAVRQTLVEMLPVEQVRVKWPNDVLVEGRKICGILLESRGGDHWAQVVVGVGLNVRNDLTGAPPDVRQRATTLAERMEHCPTIGETLEPLLTHLQGALEQLRAGELMLAQRWDSACALTGKQITVEQPHGLVTGTCRGITEGGALRVETAAGEMAVVAGVAELTQDRP